jgi:hypothetical protein
MSRGTEQDQPGEAGGVGEMEHDLRQPFVGEVEIADLFLPGIRGGPEIRGVRERIGNRQLVLLPDVLAGFEMPPRVGVARFGSEPSDQ